jgi:hypothetical protein
MSKQKLEGNITKDLGGDYVNDPMSKELECSLQPAILANPSRLYLNHFFPMP